MTRAPCPGRYLRRVICALCLLLLSPGVLALDALRIDWGDIEGDGWRMQDVTLSLSLADNSLGIRIARLDAGRLQLQRLHLSCADFNLQPGAVSCRNGRLSLHSDTLTLDAVPVHFAYRPGTRQLKLELPAVPLAGGQAALSVQQQAGSWQLAVTLTDTRLAELAALAQQAGLSLPALTLQGGLEGRLDAQGDSGGLQRIDWKLQTRDAGYSNAEGDQAAEALRLVSRGRLQPQGQAWQLQASLSAQEGMLFTDPLYLEFSAAQPLALETALRWHADRRELQVQSLSFEQPGVMRGTLAARLRPTAEQPLQLVSVELEQARLPAFYTTWVQPWLAGTVLENLETEGQLSGRLGLRDGKPESAHLKLEQVSLRETGGLFELRGLDAGLQWEDRDAVLESSLAWQGASLYRLQFGAARVALQNDRNSLKLARPLIVPLLDGQLHVEQFELGRDATGSLRWLLDGFLTPVSMQAFSTALGWPPLSGTLSGMVPKMRYEKGELTLGGTLLVQAFDGDITLRNLRIERPLGLVPRLWADIRLDHLDLKTLTRTFSFGRIEGRLQGRVDGLYMEAWQLVAFDARFETPPDDDSRHRISQKAVDNISDLGGAGLGGALSRSFLRFLEDFPYRRLGIRCRLENGVCHMGGVAPAEQGGYYLVQGRWLPPRLDVIGFADEVDWQSLVDRLVAITAGEGPRVE